MEKSNKRDLFREVVFGENNQRSFVKGAFEYNIFKVGL
jgi:hypothetical protein